MGQALSAVTGWTLFAGLALSLGAVVARWTILPRAFTGEDRLLEGRLKHTAGLGLAGALLTCGGVTLYFVRQLLEFRDPFAPWAEEAELLLTGTPWGTTWTQAVAGSVVLVVAFTLARAGRGAGWWVATAAALALGVFPGLTGHAGGVEDWRTFTLLADAAHVWAGGAWIGGLAVVLWLERCWRAGDSPGGRHAVASIDVPSEPPLVSLLPRLVPAFSPVAMVGVGVLAATGVYASWSHLPSLSALVATGYGRMLIAKVAVVAIVLAFGARNYRILTPRLGTGDGQAQMGRSAAVELAVAQVVLVLTSLLVRLSPLDY